MWFWKAPSERSFLDFDHDDLRPLDASRATQLITRRRWGVARRDNDRRTPSECTIKNSQASKNGCTLEGVITSTQAI